MAARVPLSRSQLQTPPPPMPQRKMVQMPLPARDMSISQTPALAVTAVPSQQKQLGTELMANNFVFQQPLQQPLQYQQQNQSQNQSQNQYQNQNQNQNHNQTQTQNLQQQAAAAATEAAAAEAAIRGVFVNGPAAYYDPPWPAPEPLNPLTIRMYQLATKPKWEIAKAPVAELIQIRESQDQLYGRYEYWASQQRFNSAALLAKCAVWRFHSAHMFAAWIGWSEAYSAHLASQRALEYRTLARDRLGGIRSWAEGVRVAGLTGFSRNEDDWDEDLMLYQRCQGASMGEDEGEGPRNDDEEGEEYAVSDGEQDEEEPVARPAAGKKRARSPDVVPSQPPLGNSKRPKVQSTSNDDAIPMAFQASAPVEGRAGRCEK